MAALVLASVGVVIVTGLMAVVTLIAKIQSIFRVDWCVLSELLVELANGIDVWGLVGCHRPGGCGRYYE